LSFQSYGMTLLDKNGVPQQLDLSPAVLTFVIIAMVELLLTADSGMIEATLEQELLVVAASF